MKPSIFIPERLVLAKREIPIRTKFGPFEGIIRSLTKDELVKYKKSSTDFPLLFLNQKSCLDVSNESELINFECVTYIPTIMNSSIFIHQFRYFKLDVFCEPRPDLS